MIVMVVNEQQYHRLAQLHELIVTCLVYSFEYLRGSGAVDTMTSAGGDGYR
jgi:hypothetical protein